MRCRILVLFLLSLITTNESLKILVCFPLPTKSHSILGHGIADRLLDAGHEVVHLTSFPKENPVTRLKELYLSSVAEFFKEMKASYDEMFKISNMIGYSHGFLDSFFLAYFANSIIKKVIEEPSVAEMLSDPNEKFDAVIWEWFYSEISVGIPVLLDAPLIWVSPTEPHWQILRLVDEVPNTAYAVDITATYTTPLTFVQRVEQLYKTVVKFMILNLFISPAENWLYNSLYTEFASKRGITMPSYNQAIYNASLLFINSHPSISGAMKLPQNAINIAGYHIQDHVEPLPMDLQKLMDEAKDGVIYFSMGSNMRSDGMSENMKRSLLNLFSKLDQTVIWKFESDLKDVPANVHLVKWAPQPSILSHPNLRIFVTHRGQLSTTEAIHYGVPLVGIPILADQHFNMGTVGNKGFGIKVTLSEEMFGELDDAIRKVLTNKSFKARAVELSSLYHDRPMKPGAELVYWVEYVARTRGSLHLRSPTLTVSLFQRFYLDLLSLLIVFIILIRKFITYLLKMRSNKPLKKGKRD